MDQELGRLLIKITADISELKRGFKEGQDSLKEHVDTTKGQVNSLSQAFSGLGNPLDQISSKLKGMAVDLASVYGAYRVLKESVESIVTLGRETLNLQRITGMSAEEASTWVAVGKQQGVQAEQLTTMFTMLERRMGTLKDIETMTVDETGKSVDLFKKFGIEIKNIDGSIRPVTEVFSQLRARIRDASSETERGAIAAAFFRRNMSDMMGLLTMTDEQFQEFADHAKDAGTVLSTQDVNNTKLFSVSLVQLKETLQGVFLSIGRELLPSLIELAKGLSETVAGMRQLASAAGAFEVIGIAARTAALSVLSFVEGIMTIAVATTEINRVMMESLPYSPEKIKKAEDLSESLKKKWIEISEIINRLMKGETNAPPALLPPGTAGAIGGESAKQTEATDKLKNKLAELRVELTKMVDPEKAVTLQLEDFIAKTTKGITLTPEMTKTIAQMRIVLMELQENIAWNKLEKAASQAWESITGKTEEYRLELLKLRDPIAADREEFDKMVRKMLEGVADKERLESSVKELTSAYDELKNKQKELAVAEAELKAQETVHLASTEVLMTNLKASYDKGLISAKDYYQQLRTLTQEQTQIEIDALQAKAELPTTKEEDRIALRAQIKAKEFELIKKGVQIDREELADEKKMSDERIKQLEIQAQEEMKVLQIKQKKYQITPLAAAQTELSILEREKQGLQDYMKTLDQLKDKTAFLEILKQLSALDEKMVEVNLKLWELQGSFGTGFVAGIKKADAEVTEFSIGMAAAKDAITGIGSSLTAFATAITDTTKKAKERWKDMGDSILQIWANVIKKIAATALEKGLTSLLGGIFPSTTAPNVTMGAGAVTGGEYGWGGIFQGFHGGRGPGEFSPDRVMPNAVLANAPRLHSGLGAGEMAAVLRKDESVLTPGQMRALGSQGPGSVKIELEVAHSDAHTVNLINKTMSDERIDITVASRIKSGGHTKRVLDQKRL